MLRTFVSGGINKIAQNQSLKGFLSGGKGAMAVAGMGLGGAVGYYAYGERFGGGAGVLIGMGEGMIVDYVGGLGLKAVGSLSLGPLMFGAALAAPPALATGAILFGREHHKRKRQINMAKRIHDRSGALADARMLSIRKLGRDRYNLNRSFGNEAMRFHT